LRKSRDDLWDGTDRRATPTVLVVNDDPDACEMLVRLLRPHGFRTEGAHSPDEAMSVVADQIPRCVLLDMTSGGIGSGLRALHQIRTHDDRRISTARVVLTAASPRNRLFSFQSGADAFMVRPFHLDDVVEHIRDILERPQEERARHRRDELARA
jgi:DNA-binding response OmpR family regulator